MITHRSRGLPTACLDSEHLVSKVTSSVAQTEPVNVDCGISGSGDISRPCTDDEGVGVASEAGGREVPFRRETCARGIGDEVVLSEDLW